MQAADYIIDCCFLIDILINFRTSYVSAYTGEEITEPKKITINYLSGRFWIDFIATVPFDLLFQVSSWSNLSTNNYNCLES